MNIQEIIFNLLTSNAHTWARYWITKETTGLTLPGEYVEIQSNYLSAGMLKDLLENGFNIEKITAQKVNADAYAEILMKRKLNYKPTANLNS